MELNNIIIDSTNNNMSLTDIKSGLVSGVLAAIIAVLGLIVTSGGVTSLDWTVALNFGAVAFASSLVKALGTTPSGTFLGMSVKK